MAGEIHLKVNEELAQIQTSISDDEEELLLAIKGKEKGKTKVDKGWSSWEKEKFQKIMRENKDMEKYYKPSEFSVGPIHAHNITLKNMALKRKLMKKFMINGSGKKEDKLRSAFENSIESLKTFFRKEMLPLDGRLDDAELASLLFLDGCAVLQFIHSYVTGNLKEFGISKIQEALIRQDLFLFENQIPFAVLRLLMDLINDKRKEKEASFSNLPYSFAIVEFVHRNNICDPSSYNFLSSYFSYEAVGIFGRIKPVHLLDLLWMVSIHGDIYRFAGRDDAEFPLPKIGTQELLSRQFDDQSFRNVQELKLSGIKMKPSHFPSLTSVSFSTHWFGNRGHLKLPRMIVNDSMVRKLLNLVAYETWLDDDKKHRVSSYLEFMDLLIDTEQDAKDLRTAGILRNRFSTDEDVAKVFNMMGSTHFSKSPDYYLETKMKIEEHYKRNSAIWLAEFRNYHFRSPLTVVALFLAAIVLGLQIVQTVFTINPKG